MSEPVTLTRPDGLSDELWAQWQADEVENHRKQAEFIARQALGVRSAARLTIPIPLVEGALAVVSIDQGVSPKSWDNLMAVLGVMRDGLVREDPEPVAEAGA